MMENQVYDVIVIGAGASGLMAAWELVLAGKRVIVVEARERIGGRIETIQPPGFEHPVETGAEFVHGKLKLTQMILNKAGIPSYEVTGDIWQKHDGRLQEQKDFIEDYPELNKKFKELDSDIPVKEFIHKYLAGDKYEQLRFSLKNYVEGYYAADTAKASTFALRDELRESTSKQYRIEGGYSAIINWLYHQCVLRGCQFLLSSTVNAIHWQHDHVEIRVSNSVMQSNKILVTVPVSVLQEEKILFSPAIPNKIAAAQKLGYGSVIKCLLQFDEPFWKNKQATKGNHLSKMSFIFSESIIPTWWTLHPKEVGILIGWCGGPHAKKLEGYQRGDILNAAVDSLGKIFEKDPISIHKKLIAWHISDWPSDPYGCYGYSYQVVNGPDFQKTVSEPVEGTLFFAGEGLYDGIEIGTVEAALITGQEAAHAMIAGFKN